MFRILVFIFALAGAGVAATARADSAAPLASRSFEFEYRCRVLVIPVGATSIDLWVPVASSGPHQQVELLAESLPVGAQLGTESEFGNQILHQRFEAPFDTSGGEPPSWNLRYRVTRREVMNTRANRMETADPVIDAVGMEKYLRANSMVPLDGPIAQIAGGLDLHASSPMVAGRTIYDYVLDTMAYDNSDPLYGRGDVLWACDSQAGNCSDFHSVFIGLSRAQSIPAYFEIGFPLPSTGAQGAIGGYHCWAWFDSKGAGWVPVDISEADKRPEMAEYYFGALTPDRVAFSRGRDLTLAPPQQGPPLNFFIYPYAEVDGLPHEAIEKSFAFREID